MVGREDLVRRAQTRGPKWLWALVILFVNLIGPIIYFVLKPYFGAMFRDRVDALPMVMSSCAFVLALFAVAQCIAVMMQGRARKALAPSPA